MGGGLLLEGQRKSIEPIAERIPEADAQALQQFVNQSPWEWEPLQRAMALDLLDRLLPEAVLIVDETSFPKQRTHLVAVARQYCGALGKTAKVGSPRILLPVELARGASRPPCPTSMRYTWGAWTRSPSHPGASSKACRRMLEDFHMR